MSSQVGVSKGDAVIEVAACDDGTCALPPRDERIKVNAKKEPKIDEILYSLRKPPFTFQDMKEFMESEFSAENINFWGATEQFRQTFEGVSAPARVKVNADFRDKNSAEKTIVETFVKEDAQNQVNISSKQRTEILKRSGESRVFDDAQEEIKRLMERDTLPRFLVKAGRTNITKPQADWRKRVGYFLFFLSALVAGLLIALEVAIPYKPPFGPYLRLLVLPTFVMAYGYFVSGKQQV